MTLSPRLRSYEHRLTALLNDNLLKQHDEIHERLAALCGSNARAAAGSADAPLDREDELHAKRAELERASREVDDVCEQFERGRLIRSGAFLVTYSAAGAGDAGDIGMHAPVSNSSPGAGGAGGIGVRQCQLRVLVRAVRAALACASVNCESWDAGGAGGIGLRQCQFRV